MLDGEPLSAAATSAVPTNGAAADINVYVVANPKLDASLVNILDDDDTTPPNFNDISASGEWRKAVSRAGIAYEFTAGGKSYADDDYLYPAPPPRTARAT